MTKVFNTTVSVKEGANRSVLRGIVQNDTMNEVNVRLSDGSRAFDYTGYTNIVFKVLKADGTSYVDSIGENVIATSPVDGVVTVILKGQATVAAGLCQSVIEVYCGADKMTTARFNYEVFETLGTAESTDSANQYPVFQNLMADLNELEASIAAAEAAREIAETARADAEAARASEASGYVAKAEAAKNAASMSAAVAETWAKEAKAIAGGEFAPAGYGLGNIPSYGSTVDGVSYHADGIVGNGFYACRYGTPTDDWCYILHIQNGTAVATQIAFVCFNWSGVLDITKDTMFRRVKMNSVWDAWEYVNPPMKAGAEYRTIERYQGKPVYRRVVDFGALPNATTKYVDAGFKDGFIFAIESVFAYNQGVCFHSHANIVSVVGSCSQIGITTSADMSEYSARVAIKYYKTTDT